MISSEMEQYVMQLIIYSGDAKSSAMEAMILARNNKMSEASEKISHAESVLNKAHEVQTQLLTFEARGQEMVNSLLMNHAQDHLMGAITSLDFAKELMHLWNYIRDSEER